MTDLTVANTILEQLGGRRFLAMTGAKNLSGTDDSLVFALPRNPRHVTHVRVRLDPSDTYTVTFWKLGLGHKNSMEIIGEESNVYDDNLQTVFTAGTGLYTTLGTMGICAA